MLLKNMLGTVGSIIILLLVYASSLILLTGLHPIGAARQIANWPSAYLERRRARKMEEADENERLVLEAERLERQRKKLEKTIAKRGSVPAETPAEPVAPTVAELFAESEPARPEPQIIDSSLPPPPKRKEKKDKFQPLTTLSCENYELPSLNLLDHFENDGRQAADPAELLGIQDTVIDTLAQFGISVSRGDITRGPTITRYEVYPAKGVRVDKIVSLERDIARATRAERINILAPIPGKDTVGIEIANSNKQKVTLRELLESDDFQNAKAKIPIALGKDVYGKTIIADLAAMPHGLVAGTTGSGKSVCINAIIASILYRFTPRGSTLHHDRPESGRDADLHTLPHLVVPVVTDPKKVLLALRWAIDEMEKRYAIFAKTGVRNIGTFNARSHAQIAGGNGCRGRSEGSDAGTSARCRRRRSRVADQRRTHREDDDDQGATRQRAESSRTACRTSSSSWTRLADLMQTAPADVESAIARITQKARAAGLHMILATQDTAGGRQSPA